MVVVGSAHLFGTDGLLKLLEAKGYAIERVLDDKQTKQEIFLLAYQFAKFTSLSWENTRLILEYTLCPELKNDTVSLQTQKDWQTNTNIPMTLWGYNTYRRLHRQNIEFNDMDLATQKTLWNKALVS